MCDRTHTWMGMWGAETPKSSFLFGHLPNKHRLSKKLDRTKFAKSSTCRHEQRDDGIKVTGNREALKKTQEYPKGYTDAVARLYMQNRMSITDDCSGSSSSESDYEDIQPDTWEDEDLSQVEAALSELGAGHGYPFPV